jgi:hypothetical protein
MFSPGCARLQLIDGSTALSSRLSMLLLAASLPMLSKLPPPWGPTVQQFLDLEQRCRQMATQAITKRAKKIFTLLADRYRAEADSRKKKEEC